MIAIGFGPKIGKVSGLIKPWKGIGFIDPLASLVVTYVSYSTVISPPTEEPIDLSLGRDPDT